MSFVVSQISFWFQYMYYVGLFSGKLSVATIIRIEKPKIRSLNFVIFIFLWPDKLKRRSFSQTVFHYF